MARLLDKTVLTNDEAVCVESGLADLVRGWLEKLKLDTYNNEYVIRLTVDKLDDRVGQ